MRRPHTIKQVSSRAAYCEMQMKHMLRLGSRGFEAGDLSRFVASLGSTLALSSKNTWTVTDADKALLARSTST